MLNYTANKFYSIRIDLEKNRVYLSIKGFWHNTAVVPDYLNDWRELSKLMRKNFTILLDSSEAVTHPNEVQQYRQKAQQIAIEAGMLIAAEVVSHNVIAEFQSDTMSKNTHYPKGKFKTVEEAEAWLDEVVAQNKMK